jgi:ribosomal-protein-alanine N-acetyltransferase
MTVARTARLRLRAFEPEDAPAMEAIYGDPEVMRHVGNGPVRDPEAVASMIRDYAARHAERGWSFWAVEELATGALIGDAGLWASGDEIELGYTLGRQWWGRGYATEAARACLDVARRLHLGDVVALAEPANTASLHVLEKLGMKPEGTRLAYGRVHCVYRWTA